MSRAVLDSQIRSLEAAYRGDQFHALRGNLASVLPAEWAVQPAGHSVEVFGPQPELSIADIVLHVGGAKRMYADWAFGSASLSWETIPGPAAFDMETVLAWLDEGHRTFADGLAGLTSDADLAVERPGHWGGTAPVSWFVSLIINHDLYHSGEINRQRALIRGAEGWLRGE